MSDTLNCLEKVPRSRARGDLTVALCGDRDVWQYDFEQGLDPVHVKMKTDNYFTQECMNWRKHLDVILRNLAICVSFGKDGECC